MIPLATPKVLATVHHDAQKSMQVEAVLRTTSDGIAMAVSISQNIRSLLPYRFCLDQHQRKVQPGGDHTITRVCNKPTRHDRRRRPAVFNIDCPPALTRHHMKGEQRAGGMPAY